MAARYELQAKEELRVILRRFFPSTFSLDHHIPVSAPRILHHLQLFHLPLDRRTEHYLSLTTFKLTITEFLTRLSFDTLIHSWRLDIHPNSYRLPTTERYNGIEDSVKLNQSRSYDLVSVLATPRGRGDVRVNGTEKPRKDLIEGMKNAIGQRYGRPLRAFLEWDRSHVPSTIEFQTLQTRLYARNGLPPSQPFRYRAQLTI